MSTTSSPRVRMSRGHRREQLLALGVRLLSDRPLEEISIDTLAEEAGVSRGLLYHYFGNKQDFHTAVVQRAADDLYAMTAPTGAGTVLDQLAAALARYVDYVADNYAGYVSLIRGAAGGHDELRRIYEESRAALTDRIFDQPAAQLAEQGLVDSPAARLVVRGWSLFVEEVVVEWVRDPSGLSREDLLTTLSGSLPGLLASVPAR